jgi:glutathione S-transferase
MERPPSAQMVARIVSRIETCTPARLKLKGTYWFEWKSMARLFHVPLSPYCRKVRLSLAEKKIEVELVEEKYWEQDPDFLRRNPAGKVPVLRLDGQIMSESAAICEYIEETRPEPPLMPKKPEARFEVRRLVGWFDDKFHHEVTSKLLYERVNKKVTGQGYPDSKNVKAGAKAIKYHLDYMAWLLDQRRWLAGDQMTLADFAAAAHLSSLDYVSDVDWNRSQAVKDWYAKIKSRPAFRSILADQVPAFRPPAHYADLDF